MAGPLDNPQNVDPSAAGAFWTSTMPGGPIGIYDINNPTGAVKLPPSPFSNPSVSSVLGAVNDPAAPGFSSSTGSVAGAVSGGPYAGGGLTPADGGSHQGGPPGTGNGVWGNPATQDSVDAWFAKAVLAARDNPAQLQHILASVQGPDGPQGSLLTHYLNMIKGVMAGDSNWIAEATYYATNPSDPYGSAAQNNG